MTDPDVDSPSQGDPGPTTEPGRRLVYFWHGTASLYQALRDANIMVFEIPDDGGCLLALARPASAARAAVDRD